MNSEKQSTNLQMTLREVNRVGEGQKNVPKLRFKGYEDAWEQRSFKEITFLSGKKNKDNLPLESYSITNEEGFVPQNEHFENGGTMKDADKSMYIIVSANSFAYNPARINVGSIGYKADGEDVIVSSLYEVFKTIEDIDDNFLWRWFKSPHLQRLIMKFQEGGVRLYFYYNKLCLGYISVPEYREQNKISQTLGTLDNLITLHQRKYDALKSMKKTLLSKMFPKNGEDVPEIRFKEFTDAWEQRKLGDVCEITTGRLDANAMVPDGTYDFYTSGIAKYKIDVPAFSGPAITIAGNGATVGFMHLADGLFNAYQRTYVLSNFVADRHYLFYEIGNKLPIKIAQEARTGNIPYIVMDMLTGLKLYIPASDEQNSIGIYFENIDNLITLHQRKLEELKNMKKTLLQQMFV